MNQQETLDIRNTLEYLAQECQDRNAQLQKFTHAGVDRCFSMYLERDSPFCCKKTKQKAGYTGVLCLGCNSILSGDEWRGQIVKRRRELLGLTRLQMANLAGKSKHIIKHYEYVKCPDWYMTKTKELMEKQNGK